MLRAFEAHPTMKVVYIAPLKALVNERVRDWGGKDGMCRKLRKRLVELTGDVTPDVRALMGADVIVSTPEKWDGVSRSWSTRSYVRKVHAFGHPSLPLPLPFPSPSLPLLPFLPLLCID